MDFIKRLFTGRNSLSVKQQKQWDELRESEERFRKLAESTPMAIMLYQDDRWVFMNPAVQRITGFTKEDLIGKNFWEIVHPDFKGLVSEQGKKRQSGKDAVATYELKIITRSGNERWMLLNGTSVMLGGKPAGLVNVIDIHELKTVQEELNRRNNELNEKNMQIQAAMEELEAMNEELIASQHELEVSETKYREIFSNIPVGIFRTSSDGKIVAANQELAHILGYPSVDLLMQEGPTSASFYEDAGVRSSFLEKLHADGSPISIETSFIQKTGNRIWVRIHARLRTEACTGETILEGYMQDLTQQKNSEIEKQDLEKQLLQAQKMEAIGRLAGGIAHDFNNLLTAIIGNAELTYSSMDEKSPLHENIADILSTAQRATELIRRLLVFSRKDVIKPVPLDMNTILQRTERMLGPIIGEDITLRISLKAGIPVIKADPVQMEQLILNLAVNARDAMPQGGELSFVLSDVVIHRADELSFTGVVPGKYILLDVVDTGVGMDKETIEKIFEPFFTTKGEMGTGLGLSMVYGIIKQNGGFIKVESAKGRGSRFSVLFPAAETEAIVEHHEKVVQRAVHEKTGHETVLVVEDEDMVRKLVVKTLRDNGYDVIEAQNGRQALFISESCGNVDLILSDVILPDYNGPQLVDAIIKDWPGIKVLYMSGYAEQIIMTHGILKKGINFIAKPFLPTELIRKIQEVLS